MDSTNELGLAVSVTTKANKNFLFFCVDISACSCFVARVPASCSFVVAFAGFGAPSAPAAGPASVVQFQSFWPQAPSAVA